MTVETGRCWVALQDVMDPEFPISVVDMGLIRGIDVDADGVVKVTMTYTSVACACMQWLEADIRKCLQELDGVGSVAIDVVWDPPWSVDQMTDRGKEIFRSWGVAPA
ncbi:metal-sulfur cluster assembly factor [Alicyclobacillus contaminans]|uniref:metal-sulfur cluster assembly factor n=1 Tax=Alicyclobacillus contaminans TaxID=392016 RepID=UPI000420B875|nr:metal-sulfur cluster assembly factor [Alicyclobacillus contaminans]